MALKYPGLDVVKMFSTITREHWQHCLRAAIKSGSSDKLCSWRYGLQVGLSDAAKKGLTTEKIDIWVIKRIRDVEKAMKILLRLKHKNPLDNPGHKPADYLAKAVMAKRRRDKEFEDFLMRSNY